MGDHFRLIYYVHMLFVLTLQQVQPEVPKDLNLMGFLPMVSPVWPGGPALLPAAEMAIRDVNARTDLLPDFILKFLWLDSKCNAGRSINAMFELLYSPPVKHMIIGPACSTEAEVQAQASHVWNISHFSYAATSPILANKEIYPRFFRTIPSDTRYNLARISLMRHFGWKKVATINIAASSFSAVTDDFVESVKGTDITIISQEIFDNDPFLRVQNLKQKDARIILSASYEDAARLILCAAYTVGLYGPQIVWIFPGWYTDFWWRVSLDKVPCTQDQMDTAAEGHFLTGIYFKNPREERGIAGITVSEFEGRLPLEPAYTPEAKPYEFMAKSVYDSIWGAALALNCTDDKMKNLGYNKTLDQFEYADNDIGDMMTECLYTVKYLGLTGNVHFDGAGEPLKNIRIVQIRDLQKITVGTYVIEEDPRHLEWHNGGIIWRGGVPPRDSTLMTYVETKIPYVLYIVMSCLASAGILLALTFFTFNVVYRNQVYVKLSSPNINNVLLLGCILSYSTVFMYTCTGQNVVLCKMRHFTFTIGFTMAFGAMFSKTWRVYRIFCNKRLLRIKIRDSQLIAIVVLLLGVMLVILIVWESIDPLYIRTLYLQNQVTVTGNDAEEHPFLRDCISEYYNHFLWTICITEGVMLAFGGFLSFETRKVKIDALNDSRYIGMCLYNVIILSVLGLTLSLLLSNQVVLVYGIASGFTILGTTVTQLIVFLPKIISVFSPHAVDAEPNTLPGSRLGNMQTLATTSFTLNTERDDQEFIKSSEVIRQNTDNKHTPGSPYKR